MKIKAFLLLALAQTAQAHTFIFYVMRITNNTGGPITLYCKNFMFQPVLFTSPRQLNDFRLRDDGKDPSVSDVLFKQYRDLLFQMDIVQQRIISSHGDLNTNDEFNALKKQREALEMRLRPVIPHGQTLSDIPCRLYSPSDVPNMGAIEDWNNRSAQIADVLQWKPSETFILDANGRKIEVFDTNGRYGCPVGYIKVFARSGSKISSVCVEDDPNSRIQLIINPDGFELKTFKVYALQ